MALYFKGLKETTSSNNGKTIGLTTAGNTKVSSRDLFREAVQKNGLGGTSEADAESQTENGIVSNKCQNGKMIDSWELKDTNPNDTKKVQDLLNRFEKDANLIFSGSKDFWEEFLNSG